ncbi:MAG: hypothetical protein ACOCRK_06210 [bacterium]
MKQWRKDYLRKMKTKAWSSVGFPSQMYDVIYCDDDVDDNSIPLKTILEELIWWWYRLNEPNDGVCKSYSNYQKRAYKQVADNFLEKYYDEDLVADYVKPVISNNTLD